MLVGRLHTALAEIAVDVSAPILKFDSGMTNDGILLYDNDEDKNAPSSLKGINSVFEQIRQR